MGRRACGTRRHQPVENSESILLADVRIDLARAVQHRHIPASALIIGQQGRVATVESGNRAADDQIIVTPPDGLSDGDEVRIANARK